MVEAARAAAERSDVKLEITVVGRDKRPISSLPLRAPEPPPCPTPPPPETRTGDAARQAEPPSKPPPANIVPQPEPVADSMSPLSFDVGTNNWSNAHLIGGGSSYEPFSDPHPYLGPRGGRSRY
jgi:hypothetical protein